MKGKPSGRPSLRAERSNPFFFVATWIASSRSLSSGAHSRDPLGSSQSRQDTPIPATHCARVLDERSAPGERGECRVPVAPAVWCGCWTRRVGWHQRSSARIRFGVPRMPRSTSLSSRRGALLIRGPCADVGPGSAVHRQETLHRVRDTVSCAYYSNLVTAIPDRPCLISRTRLAETCATTQVAQNKTGER
jgi:hypothetical protein